MTESTCPCKQKAGKNIETVRQRDNYKPVTRSENGTNTRSENKTIHGNAAQPEVDMYMDNNAHHMMQDSFKMSLFRDANLANPNQ